MGTPQSSKSSNIVSNKSKVVGESSPAIDAGTKNKIGVSVPEKAKTEVPKPELSFTRTLQNFTNRAYRMEVDEIPDMSFFEYPVEHMNEHDLEFYSKFLLDRGIIDQIVSANTHVSKDHGDWFELSRDQKKERKKEWESWAVSQLSSLQDRIKNQYIYFKKTNK